MGIVRVVWAECGTDRVFTQLHHIKGSSDKRGSQVLHMNFYMQDIASHGVVFMLASKGMT